VPFRDFRGFYQLNGKSFLLAITTTPAPRHMEQASGTAASDFTRN
jgi:hypothetical protein